MSKNITANFFSSRLSKNRVAFLKPGRSHEYSKSSHKPKSFFVTDQYYEAVIYKPLIPNPALRTYIERSKVVPKEQRIKESKLVSTFKDQVLRNQPTMLFDEKNKL